MFKARGIDKPFAFLQKAGFSDNFSSKIKNNRVSRLDLNREIVPAVKVYPQ